MTDKTQPVPFSVTFVSDPLDLISICRLILSALASGQIEHSLREELTPSPLLQGEKNGNRRGGLRSTSWRISGPGLRSRSTNATRLREATDVKRRSPPLGQTQADTSGNGLFCFCGIERFAQPRDSRNSGLLAQLSGGLAVVS
jgi:hypothetical protein